MVRDPVGLGRGGNRRRAEVTDRFPQFVVAPAPHASDVPSNELESFRRADLIMEATDEAGESSYIAVEISFTVNGRDTDRAMLSFSVPEGVSIPKSLQNIFSEIGEDVGTETPQHGNLTRWAEQGVLLLNTIHTVECGKSLSHRKYG